MIAIVDAGPLLAAVDEADSDHEVCVQVLEHHDLDLIVPTLIVAEVSYFLGTRHGARVEANFIRTLVGMEVEAPNRADWLTMADLMERYANFPLGAADASVAVLAERLGTELIVTLDRRHFGALRMPGGRTFHLLP